jgi:hypothetical protein
MMIMHQAHAPLSLEVSNTWCLQQMHNPACIIATAAGIGVVAGSLKMLDIKSNYFIIYMRTCTNKLNAGSIIYDDECWPFGIIL